MKKFFIFCLATLVIPLSFAAEGILDYDRFMAEIEPLLITKTYASPGPTPMRCIDCHGDTSHQAYSAYPLVAGQSRSNFIETGDEINLETPATSLLLRKPLDGGTGQHGTSGINGGKPFASSLDPDYQTIINWISDAANSQSARITQTEPHPNPFRYRTDIVYFLSSAAIDVDVSIFTNNGKQLRSFRGPVLVGANKITWDGRDEFGEPLPTGLYFYRVKATFRDDTVVKGGRVIYTP